MGWETRGRGRYYTRSRRVGGRVVREYLGFGETGERAALADARRRAQRQAERLRRLENRARLAAAEQPLIDFCEAAELLARAVLLTANFHRHDRGEWRRRHHE